MKHSASKKFRFLKTASFCKRAINSGQTPLYMRDTDPFESLEMTKEPANM
ncbi:hypothetical protein SAMN05421736_104241 [Evansella caseinilytica]|uniref:Uncharacterized protein n=1 Tax=Evansella caseinilytica TaxID=1503961 RepID=A0A1H3NXF7_9BACI|nr:hypothetical protein SAMN05421736_104241 [Evansella caseinilytica]